jgi:hypothetical protein
MKKVNQQVYQVLVFIGLSTKPDVFPFKEGKEAKDFLKRMQKQFKGKDAKVVWNAFKYDKKRFPQMEKFYFG